jgi:hypothetical protein
MVFVSLVTPHLKDDYLTKNQNINSKHLKPDVAFLLALKMMDCVSPHHLKSWQCSAKANLVHNCQFNEESTFYLAPRKARKILLVGETNNFPTYVPPPLQRHFCN